jgi:ABC-type transport system involved in cytochrome bd biosynthesis fused ATPase/permease subunit
MSCDQTESMTGQALNLISNDISNIETMFIFTPYLILPVIVVTGGIYLLISSIGFKILAGLPILFLILLVTTLLANYNTKLRLKAADLTDKRIDKINEILNAIKLIKMFCWEKSYIETVNSIRK